MILTLLQGGELGYGAAAVVLRADYYTCSLGGAVLAFFALLFGARLDLLNARRLRRWAISASMAAIVAALGALTAHVGVLMGRDSLTEANDMWLRQIPLGYGIKTRSHLWRRPPG